MLSEELKKWRAERPDEWKMDEFIRKAESLEEVVKAVAHVGIDFGFGKYELQDSDIDKARLIFEDKD